VSNANEQNFFSDTATAPDVASAPAHGQAATQPAASKAALRTRLKPVHGFVALCAVALVWVAWPRSPSAGHGDAVARSVDTSATRYSDDLDANPPAVGPSVKAIAASATAAQVPVAAVPSPAPPPVPAIATEEAAALHAQVASLSAELDSERASHATCSARSSRTTTNSIQSPTHRPVRASQPRGPREVLVDYHLNTISNGQAWIERANQTFVVEKGGTVGGARVERIDAAAHVVETSLGDIR
jgi:hypothetical protein